MDDEPELAAEGDELEEPICPKCLRTMLGPGNRCENCGAQLTLLGPYEQVLATGSAYRTASDSPQKLIVVIGMRIVFGPPLMFCLAGMLYSLLNIPDVLKSIRNGHELLTFLTAAVMVLGFTAISARMLYKTTTNYRRSKEKWFP